MTASRLAIASFIGLAVLSPLGCGENDDSGARPDESAGSGGSEAGAGGEAGSAGEGNQGGAAGASGNGGLGGSSGKSCGNGTLDSGETCDPGIKTGQGKCQGEVTILLVGPFRTETSLGRRDSLSMRA